MILDQIAIKHGTDKSSKHHGYCRYYEQHLNPLRDQRITLLEIGYGGYAYADRGGESACTWHEYFPLANIVSVDLYEKTNLLKSSRYRFFQGSQDDECFLKSVIQEIGAPDVFIDDGSHRCDLTLRTFEIVFPLLKSKGWYIIEDTETSYSPAEWARGTADSNDFTFPHPVNLGRKLINDINQKYIGNYTPQYEVSEIHFYQNIIFIKKK